MMRFWFLLIPLLACGEPTPEAPPVSPGRSLGQVCTQPDQCADGLSCLAQPDTAEWCDQESYCTIACTDDDACLDAFGEGHICVDWCGAALCFEGSRG